MPIQVYERVRARADKRNVDITVEAAELLVWALDNIDKPSAVHTLGQLGPLIDYLERKEKKRRK